MDDVAICNLALARAKVATRIEALTENSAEGRACATVYGPARDRLLAAYRWPWSRKSATLALLEATPDAWAYAYALPSDCLTPLGLDADLRSPRPDQRLEFEIVKGAAGLELHTDQPEAVLLYIARSDDPGLWSPAFRDALAWAVAADLALVLVKDEQLARILGERGMTEASTAAGIVRNTAEHKLRPTSRIKAARQ